MGLHLLLVFGVHSTLELGNTMHVISIMDYYSTYVFVFVLYLGDLC